MNTRAGSLIAGGILAGAAISAPLAAGRIEAGMLDCDVSEGAGMIITSKKSLVCTFHPSTGGKETYGGTIAKFGIDIGSTTRGRMVWAVLAPTREIPPGALAGDYAGISAEATAGIGIGANALLGGLEKSIALQPLSLQSQEGLNIAAGVSSLKLRLR